MEAGVKYKSKAPANATTEDTCPVHNVVLALCGPEGVNSGLPTTLSRLLSFGSGFAFVAPPVMVGACEALRRFAGSAWGKGGMLAFFWEGGEGEKEADGAGSGGRERTSKKNSPTTGRFTRLPLMTR